MEGRGLPATIVCMRSSVCDRGRPYSLSDNGVESATSFVLRMRVHFEIKKATRTEPVGDTFIKVLFVALYEYKLDLLVIFKI